MTTLEKIGLGLGVCVALVLLGMIFFSTNGVMDYWDLKEKEDQVKAQVVLEARQNRKMEKEIKSLKHDIEYIKHLAKHEHEMAGPDELIFKEKTKTKEPEK
ncbi:MAG: septum formation initiator family protein [Desulfobacterales bacterium]|nr:septum formation initiator family protein [Desulfobacterales bacterium]